MSGATIADQVHVGLMQAAKATGVGTYTSLLRKKSDGTFEYADIVCVSTTKKSFDTMAMVQRTQRVLLVSPTGPVPVKGDHIGVGFKVGQQNNVKQWARIEHVDEVNPAGTVLLYRLRMAE